jgi:VanZ family protein
MLPSGSNGLATAHVLMDPASERRKPNYAGITAGVVAILIYGSFFPFAYVERPNPGGALRALLATWQAWPGRIHFTMNVVMYVPLGFFAILSLPRRKVAWRIVQVSIAGLALSFAIEWAQYFARERDSELADVYGNLLGTLVGALAGAFVAHRIEHTSRSANAPRPFVLLLLLCWLGFRLSPLVPVFRWDKYPAAWKTILQSPAPAPLDLFRHVAIWLAIALPCEGTFGKGRTRSTPVLLFAIVLLSRTVLVGVALSPAEVWGGALGVLLWIAVVSRLRLRAVLVVAMFAVAVAIQALEPFTFQTPARAFGMVPFRSFIEAPTETGVRTFLEKVFTYGALVWLIARTGLTTLVAAITGVVLVLGLRWLQVYLPGRSAEITDAVMLLLIAGLMYLMAEDPQELASREAR